MKLDLSYIQCEASTIALQKHSSDVVKAVLLLDLYPYKGISGTCRNLHPVVTFLQTGRANIMATAPFIIDLG